jgi:hypothetical protein
MFDQIIALNIATETNSIFKSPHDETTYQASRFPCSKPRSLKVEPLKSRTTAAVRNRRSDTVWADHNLLAPFTASLKVVGATGRRHDDEDHWDVGESRTEDFSRVGLSPVLILLGSG